MKSRITIDLNEENQPIVRVHYLNSDDVRDKMVKRFLEGFGGSDQAYVQFTNYDFNDVNSTLEIIPMSVKQKFYVENSTLFQGIALGISQGDFMLETWSDGISLGVSRSGKTSEGINREYFNNAGYQEKYELVNKLYQQVK